MIRLGLDDYRPPREEQRAITLADFPSLALTPPAFSGIRVSEAMAHEYPPFRNGVVVISSDIGKIQRRAWKRLEDDTREKQEGTYLDKILRQPNPYINDLDLWATIAAHALTCGNGYLEIERDRATRPIGLWPILPEFMEPIVEGNTLLYRYKGQKMLKAESIVHIKGPSSNGLKGDDTVHLARQSLGLGIAAERFGASFFGNGAHASVVFVHPGKFDTEQRQRFKASWDALYRGPDKAHGTAVTEQGMKPERMSVNPDEAQSVETREHQVVETARILNLPPHKLKHKMGERPGANLTESEQDYLNNTLDPWLVRIEQELSLKLIPEAQRSSVYIEHDRNAYLRMTPNQRVESYKSYFDMGILSAEGIAKKENLPAPEESLAPISDRIENVGQLVRAGFDPEESLAALGLPKIKHLGPLPVTVQGEEKPAFGQPALPPAPDDAKPVPDDARMKAAQRKLAIDVAAMFVRTEATEARRAAKKGQDGFQVWLGEFYERKADLLAGSLTPLVEVEMARRGVNGDSAEVARGLARGYVERSKDELLDLRTPDLEAQVDRLTERWKVTRPAEMADQIAAIGGFNA